MVVSLERETLLDLSVNLIPLGMLLVFIALFLVNPKWGTDWFMLALSVALAAVPFLFLALVTYVSGAVIQKEEEEESDAGPV